MLGEIYAGSRPRAAVLRLFQSNFIGIGSLSAILFLGIQIPALMNRKSGLRYRLNLAFH